MLGAGLPPDFRTICRFRTRHRDDFTGVFVQVVQIAVDEHEQIIVATLVTNVAPDVGHLIPVIDRAEQAVGASP